MRLLFIEVVTFVFAAFFSCTSPAYEVSGRITLGTYDGKETLADTTTGDASNDVQTVSGRFYLRIYDMGDSHYEFVTDIRDKHDFFGLVDSQRLALVDRNTLQFRQLSFKAPWKVVFMEVGRFPIPEAGAVYCDGGLFGINITRNLRWAAFGGYNPKRPEQTWVQWNPDSQTFGTYLTYTPAFQPWGTAFYIDTAAVSDIVQNFTTRNYWYLSSVYQWNPLSRISLMTYLDFVPNTYLQNGTFTYSQGLGPNFQFSAEYFSIDVLEYLYLQSVRSQLPPSPYHEADARMRFIANNNFSVEGSFSYGHRYADDLERKEASLGLTFTRFFSPHWDMNLWGGYRNNFTSNDEFANLQLGYFSKLWEIDLSEDAAIEKYSDGAVFHPLISEIGVSRIFGNNLYSTISYQFVTDERVQIHTIFAKISYRFGTREIPPVRDGAPPRGHL